MSFSDCTYCISAELKHWDSGDSVFCKLQLAMFRFTEFPICKKRNLSFCTYACPCLKRRTFTLQGSKCRINRDNAVMKAFSQHISAAV